MAAQTMSYPTSSGLSYAASSIPCQPSTVALAGFASDLEKEITEKILKKLQLKRTNPNNTIMVLMCRLVDDALYNINKDMSKIGIKFEQLFSTLSEQQQQIIDNNNRNINSVLKKLNIYDVNIGDMKLDISYKMNENKKQLKEIMNELNGIKHKQLNEIKMRQNILSNQKENGIQINNLKHNQIKCNNDIIKQLNNIQKSFKEFNKELKEENEEYKNIINDHQKDSLSTSIALQSLRTSLIDIQNDLDSININKTQPTELSNNKPTNELSKTNNNANINKQMVSIPNIIMNNINKIEKELSDIDSNSHINHIKNEFITNSNDNCNIENVIGVLNENNKCILNQQKEKYNHLNENKNKNKFELANESILNKQKLVYNNLNRRYIELEKECDRISNDYNKLNNRYNFKSVQFADLSMDYKNICNSIELFHFFIPNLTATKEVFCINKTVALQSELIRIILEGDDNESGIKMMNVSVAVIQSVIKYMNYYHQIKGNENLLKQFEDTFVGDNENIKNEILFVAEFMGIDALIKLLQL